MKKISSRLANLTPAQRESLLNKLREQKKQQTNEQLVSPALTLESAKADESNLRLSFAQQRIWFIDQIAEQKSAYNIPAQLTLKGLLNVKALEQSFVKLIQRHESLRTSFESHNGISKAVILNGSRFSLKQSSLCHLLAEEQTQQLNRISTLEANKPFMLQSDILIRAHLVQLGDKESKNLHALLICIHHIIADAWSMHILLKELSITYAAYCDNKEPDLGEIPFRYVDFSAWQHQQLASNSYQHQIRYWNEVLKGVEILNFPLDKPRPPQQSYSGQVVSFSIPKKLTVALQNLASRESVTLFSVLLSAWNILLYRYTGKSDICVGIPSVNRNHTRLESTIGIFINTLVIRSTFSENLTFIDFLHKLRKTLSSAFVNQDIPFEKLVDELSIDRDMSQSAIFQNLFSFQEKNLEKDITFSQLNVELNAIHTQTAKFDFSLNIFQKDKYLDAEIEFNSDLFFLSTIERLSANYIALLESVVENPLEKVSLLTVISDFESKKQLQDWRYSEQAFSDSNIVEQFRLQVEKSPDAIALRYDDLTLSYRELDQQSNQVAHYLLQQGIKSKNYVGLCLNKSIDLIISIFATIKMGAIYLPIDASYPYERIKLLINEGELACLLTENSIYQSSLVIVKEDIHCPIFKIDSLLKSDELIGQSKEPLSIKIHPEQLLYSIFTSGSTGKPKRTGATHRSESNLVHWYNSQNNDALVNNNGLLEQASVETKYSNRKHYLLVSPIGFDLTQKNIFTPLLNGDLLVLPKMEYYDPDYITGLINEQAITCLNCSPSTFYPIVQNHKNFSALSSLKSVVLGGETIQVEKLQTWLQQADCRLINSYGPSECTDVSSFYVINTKYDLTPSASKSLGPNSDHSTSNKLIPIGKPIPNAHLLILDDNLQLLPIGAHGQLFIGGTGLGPGYLGDSQLTAEKFIEYPLSYQLEVDVEAKIKTEMLYATGDIARYLNNGNIQYICRSDSQIKIRGHRVETAEIIRVLLSENNISDAVITLNSENGERELLIAYLIVKDQNAFNLTSYRALVKQHLPDYMVPSIFQRVDTFPLTANGKVDLNALPKPDLEQLSEGRFLAPRNNNEKILQGIWQKVLGIEKIGINDNFFDLGGDSILSIQIISAAKKKGLQLSPQQIFRYPNISSLASIAENIENVDLIEQGLIKGPFSLSPIQSWFFESFDKINNKEQLNHFNQSILLQLKKEISIESLYQIVLLLSQQHDVLNLSFYKKNNIWNQKHRDLPLSLNDIPDFVSAVTSDDIVTTVQSIHKKLTIESGKLFHFCYIENLQSDTKQWNLYLVVHHLVMDGISWRILLEDLDTLLSAVYDNTLNIQHSPLSAKTLSFKQWNENLANLAASEYFESDKDYWLDKTESIINYNGVFSSLNQENYGTYRDQKRIHFSLDEELTKKLLKNANKTFHTNTNDILLSALYHAFINEYNKKNKIDKSNAYELLIQLEGHGRTLDKEYFKENSSLDISRSLGWFTSLYPVLLSYSDFSSDCTWDKLLKSIKEQLHQIPNQGLGFSLYSLLNDKLSDQLAELSPRKQKPCITFNYLGQFDTQLNATNFNVNTSLRHLEGAESIDQHADLVRPNALDVLVFVADGCLQCDFLYDAHSISKSDIHDYLVVYEESLVSLIEYCCTEKQSYLTPSDLMASNISQDQIEIIEQHTRNIFKNSEEYLTDSINNESAVETVQKEFFKTESENEKSAQIETIHDILPVQSGMLFHSIFSHQNPSDIGKASVYLEQFCVLLEGELDIHCLEEAWRTTMIHHANLRSSFYWDEINPQQIVIKDFLFSIQQHDIQNEIETLELSYPGSDIELLAKKVLLEYLEKDKNKGFDLSDFPLMRVQTLAFDRNKHWLIWSYHHILLDGWSVPLVFNTLLANYENKLNAKATVNSNTVDNSTYALQDSAYDFEDYVVWYTSQKTNIKNLDLASELTIEQKNNPEILFWKEQLSDFLAPNPLDLEPLSSPITEKNKSQDSITHFSLSTELSQDIQKFAKNNRLTLNSVMQGAWAKLLSHYSNNNDVTFGSTVSGRSNEVIDIEKMVGLFINTLPFRIKIDTSITALDFLKAIQDKQQALSQYQTTALSDIKKIVGIDAKNNLFDSIFVFESFPVNNSLRQANTFFEIKDLYSFENTHYPIAISVDPGSTDDSEIHLRVLFDNARYRKTTMQRLLGHFKQILEGFLKEPHAELRTIPYITCREREFLRKSNETTTGYPREANLTELFLAQVKQFPNQVAIKFDQDELSYQALNQKANQLARYLVDHQCQPGDRVVLFMDRSIEFLTAVVAVSKTAAAYIPIDPNYPEDRLRYMLTDCEPSCIITMSANRTMLQELLAPTQDIPCEVLYLNELEEQLNTFSIENYLANTVIKATDMAYLMYTSGSSGQPKAVCLSHRSIIRLVVNTWYVNITPDDRIGHICNVCFDASAYEMWGALINGASLIGFDKDDVLSKDAFATKLSNESVTNMLLPTSLFHFYGRHHPEIFKKMKTLLVGGEPLFSDLTRYVLQKNPQLNLLNVYGPTENGVLTTVFDTRNLSADTTNTPVGKPISNTTVYIVDESLQEVPIGVVGELLSGGDGVGLGYWNKERLTRQSYIDDKFSDVQGTKMYRTGDLARRLPNGEFEIIGRKDQQLKVRGFRIEPGEIIQCLTSIDGVKDAVVVDKPVGNDTALLSENRKQLCAYFIRDEFITLSTEELIKSLRQTVEQSLPSYMIPNAYMELESIPITENGKLDKQALPAPTFAAHYDADIIAPRNEKENKLSIIWCEVLNLNPKSLSIFDNFFEIGGDSIISIQIVSRAQREGINISPKVLFENPTIAELATQIDAQDKIIGEQGLVQGEVTLSPIQHWFFNQDMTEAHHFNQSLLFNLTKTTSMKSLILIVSELLKQHDVFRLRFFKSDHGWLQTHDNSSNSLFSAHNIVTEHTIKLDQNFDHTTDIGSADNHVNQYILKHSKMIQSSLSLEQGPLFKVVLYHVNARFQKMLFIVHHLIFDGVSWRILFDDLALALEQQGQNETPMICFGPKTTSFQSYTEKLLVYAKSDAVKEDSAYWLDLFQRAGNLSSSDTKLLNIASNTQPDIKKSNGGAVSKLKFSLNKEMSYALLFDCHASYQTEVQDILILALSLALKKTNTLNTPWMDVENHGRDILQKNFSETIDTTRTLAWFTTLYPILIDLSKDNISDNALPSLIKQLKNNLRNIPKQGASYMLLAYFDNEFAEKIRATPKPDISFNYLGKVAVTQEHASLSIDQSYIVNGITYDNSVNNRSTYPFNFSALYQDDQFHFNILYNNSYIENQRVNEVQEQFLNCLSSILSHCCDMKNFAFTPSDIPYFPMQQNELDDICHSFKESKPNQALQALYPLSPMQQGMLFHSRLDKNSGMYCEQISVFLEGELNIDAMEAAWKKVIQQHEILRTSFIWENIPQPLQLVSNNCHLAINLLDWSEINDVEKALDNFLKDDREKGFDFHQPPLIRLHYIIWPSSPDTNKRGRFIWTYHHILLDGWSMPLLMRAVFEYYNKFNQASINNDSQSFVFPVEKLIRNEGRYENYIAWLYTDLVEKREESEAFWKNYLKGFNEPNDLKFERIHNHENNHKEVDTKADRRADEKKFLYDELDCQLNEIETQQLSILAARHKITLNTLMQAAWALLLSRYSGESDIVFGITVSGRPAELNDVESIIGLFINTIPLRIKLESELKLGDWLKDIFNNHIQLREFESSALVDIQAQSTIESSRALFDSILVFENYPIGDVLNEMPEGLALSDLKVYEQTNFPLSLIILPAKKIDIRLLFDTHRFDLFNIKNLLKHFKQILLSFSEFESSQSYDNDTALSNIQYLDKKEIKLISPPVNKGQHSYPKTCYLHQILAEYSSNNTAIIEDNNTISFQQLHEKSSRLASLLLENHKVKKGDRVVVCLGRSIDFIVSILAILKLGATYVPLDPEYPEERQRYMLEDTQTRLIISDPTYAAFFQSVSEHKSFRDSLVLLDIQKALVVLASIEPLSDNYLTPYQENEEIPAAILYTSGSMGQPKGVCLSHRGLARMVLNTNYMQVSNKDRVAHISNLCFDAASFEIWAALLNGIPLVVFTKDIVLDLIKFEESLKSQEVSIVLITTALFNLVAREQLGAFKKLNYLFFGGESCDINMVRRVLTLDKNKPKHLMHMYGPSENSTYSTAYEVLSIAPDAKTLSIGKAISNTEVFIMNALGDPVPPGVVGEIVCAGDGLALSYLNKPEQTKKSFVMRSVFGAEAKPMYLTGDLGCLLPDGNIEIVGRIDNQVKIRGYRIEPEEAIAYLNSLAQIKKSYILAKEDDNHRKYLVAYYVPENNWIEQQQDKQARLTELKSALHAIMPEYMVPSFYVEIKDLPLTANGKIDTQSLPPIEQSLLTKAYYAPVSDLEKALVDIWQDVLQREKIGINDDLFTLGGHSLLATQIHSRIRQQLSIDLPLRTLFELPTIRQFSEFWETISMNQSTQASDKATEGDEEFEEGEL